MTDEGLWKRLRVPALVYASVIFVLCIPVWTSLGERVIGHSRSDVWKHLWGDHWFREAFVRELPVPLYTTQVGAPDGGMLYNLDPITGMGCWLFGFLPLVPVHNFIQSLAIVLGALGAAVLAERWVHERSTAWIAGAVYGFSSHIQAVALSSGIGETAHIGGLPWSLWALLRILDGSERRSVLLLGLMLAWAAVGSWYYGLVASVGCVVLLARWLVAERLREAPDWSRLKRGVLGGGLGVLLVLPLAESFWSSMQSEQGLHWVGSVGLEGSDLSPERNYAVATVADFFAPGARVQDKVDLLYFSNHPGFLALALGILGLLHDPRRGRWLLAGMICSALLCMGPEIYLDRENSLGPNPLFLIFRMFWPGFELVQNLERMQVGVSLCLGILAALGTQTLVKSLALPARGALLVSFGLCAVIPAEANVTSGLGFPLPTASVERSDIYTELAERDGEFSVIELPVNHGGAGRAYWNQVKHGRPLPLTLDGNPSVSVQDNLLFSQFLSGDRYDRFFLDLRSAEATTPALQQARADLVEMGFHYVLLEDTDEAPETELRLLLDRVCGYPIREDHEAGLRLYKLK